MCEREQIGEYIPALYNVLFQNKKDECFSHACEQGDMQCVCLGLEQAALIRKYWIEEDPLVFVLKGDIPYFINEEYEKDLKHKHWLCIFPMSEKKKNKFFINQSLYEKKDWQCVWNRFTNNLKDTAIMLSVVFTLNTQKSISGRHTLRMLCIASPYHEIFTEILFKTILLNTIEWCMEAESNRLENYEKNLIIFFEEWNLLYDLLENKHLQKKLYDDAEMYMNALYATNDNILRTVATQMNQSLKRREYENGNDSVFSFGNVSEAERAKYGQLYCIVKMLLELEGVSTAGFPKLNISADICYNYDFDLIINVLQNIKENKKQKKKVLNILKDVFAEGFDIPDETLVLLMNCMKS